MEQRQYLLFTGSLLGGAVGDALGGPVEFDRYIDIQRKYGEVTGYIVTGSNLPRITDDTQMTLFTAEGLLRAFCRGNQRGIKPLFARIVYHAYLRWLYTQGEQSPDPDFNVGSFDGWLIKIRELHQRRAPGNTCLSALKSGSMGSIEKPINNSKGCGGVMRVAPVGLIMFEDAVFDTACEIAAITHGHPSGYLAAGVFAQIIAGIKNGLSLQEAIDAALALLKVKPDHAECLAAIQQALALAERERPSAQTIESMGGGWVAEEALAISLYCALTAKDDFSRGVLHAVNHSGDSDSTGSMTGNLLGTLLGRNAIPEPWLKQLELCKTVEDIAIDLMKRYEDTDAWQEKYPGW